VRSCLPRPHASGVVPAFADAVWSLVRDFNSLPVWHPAITDSELASGSGAEVGAVRKLTLSGSAPLSAQLQTACAKRWEGSSDSPAGLVIE